MKNVLRKESSPHFHSDLVFNFFSVYMCVRVCVPSKENESGSKTNLI